MSSISAQVCAHCGARFGRAITVCPECGQVVARSGRGRPRGVFVASSFERSASPAQRVDREASQARLGPHLGELPTPAEHVRGIGMVVAALLIGLALIVAALQVPQTTPRAQAPRSLPASP